MAIIRPRINQFHDGLTIRDGTRVLAPHDLSLPEIKVRPVTLLSSRSGNLSPPNSRLPSQAPGFMARLNYKLTLSPTGTASSPAPTDGRGVAHLHVD